MYVFRQLLALLPAAVLAAPAARDSHTEYINPVIPGYRPDPSCVAVDGMFYCTSSTFNNFPGLPIYASRDLIHWRHVSNAIHSEDQIPEFDIITGQQQGIFAPTLRHHEGVFYIITTFMGARSEDDDPSINGENSPIHFIFNTTDPFDSQAWGTPVRYVQENVESFDPDLYFDDDGQAWVAAYRFDYPGNDIYRIDTSTGEYGNETWNLWNGTGGVWPEAPHIYKKDEWYYCILAEGGTSFNHMVVIARSPNLTGPYEPYSENPILTNTNTSQYFQSVGHADLFQDFQGNWWGMALAIRQGPPNELAAYPMGRETVLFPVTWEEGEWPVLEPVRGRMRGPLPPTNMDVPSDGPWVSRGDDYGFDAAAGLPLHFMHFRFPPENMTRITPEGALVVNPSTQNLSGSSDFVPSDRISYLGRRQEHTFFTFFVDIEYEPVEEGEEAGVTLFANMLQHADLGLTRENGTMWVRLRSSMGSEELVEVGGVVNGSGTIRLMIHAARDSGYDFYVGSPDQGDLENMEFIGTVPGILTSGDDAEFTGTTVGVFATANGGNGSTPATFVRWSYTGQAQKVDFDDIGSQYPLS